MKTKTKLKMEKIFLKQKRKLKINQNENHTAFNTCGYRTGVKCGCADLRML